jgi:hypothetical protein
MPNCPNIARADPIGNASGKAWGYHVAQDAPGRFGSAARILAFQSLIKAPALTLQSPYSSVPLGCVHRTQAARCGRGGTTRAEAGFLGGYENCVFVAR